MIEYAKLHWQCRRGTKELDFLLLRYLDIKYLLADKEEQSCFIELLALEDDVLLGLLLSDVTIESVAMQALTRKIFI